jgi:hypothetical protein
MPPDNDQKLAIAAAGCSGCFGCLGLLSVLLQPLFFIAGLPFRIRRALRKRAFHTGYQIDQPPFPTLTWTEYDWWEGEIELTGWADFRLPDAPSEAPTVRFSLTVLPADQTASGAMPSPAQITAAAYLISESSTLAKVVCEAVLPYFNAALEAGHGFFDDLHPITSPDEARGLLSLSSVYIHHHHQDGIALIGLGFGCAWDEEHGFGVLLHRSTVLDVGEAEVSFREPPEHTLSH